MNNIWIIFACLAVSVFSHSGFAANYEVVGALNSKTLSLDLKEKDATAAACDLIVEKFEFMGDMKVLNLTLAEAVQCPIDSIGPRRAHLDWNVPFNFSALKTVHLRVDGKIIGILSIKDQSVSFRARGR